MLNRRSLFSAFSAVASVAALPFASAQAKTNAPKKSGLPVDFQPRGQVGRFERLPTQTLDAQHEFFTHFRGFVNGPMGRVCNERAAALMAEAGYAPDADIPVEKIVDILGKDPVISMQTRSWLSTQQLTWKTARDAFYANYDAMMEEMEKADKSGPGTLELNPDMEIPDYTRHEIHIQPGGYVGDPFAGLMYIHGTNNFYFGGRNAQDQIHIAIAQNMPLPADGKVKRILDVGCGPGQLTVALKERFPDAEVWGIDIGGPLVRYAHTRAVDMNVDCNFAQRLAEDSKFPDGHFDIVTSYILFHEVPTAKAREIIKEGMRITRAGGVFYPVDFPKRVAKRTAYQAYRSWWDHRWNNEPYTPQYHANDITDIMKEVGFAVDTSGKSLVGNFGPRHGTKPA
jgi:ubiquinone/menaquinone biosynthesis C-methylase UbiE